MNGYWQRLNEQSAGLVEQVRQSLVSISNGRDGQGAGTIWHEDGLVLTNAHVVLSGPGRRRGSLSVRLWDERVLAARLLAFDRRHDVAALAVDANDLPTIELGESRRLRPGHWVLSVGHPWGVMGAASAGMVIGVGANLPGMPNGANWELIAASLQLRPGHSGGPMVDASGRLVGINTMIAGPEVGLAVPVHVVKRFLKEALEAEGEERPAPAMV